MKKLIFFMLFLLSSLLLVQAKPQKGFYNITDYGAVANGKKVNTDAINKAITICAKNGGGTVLVPAGTFISGTIILKSNVTLHLQPGATIKGSDNIADYRVDGNMEGLIFAKEANHVSVIGRGILDGNGIHFMQMNKRHPSGGYFEYTRQGKSYAQGLNGIADGPVEPLERPAEMLRFMYCSNVLLRGITIRDSPNWTIHLGYCKKSNITGITINNNLLIPNNDGIHLTICQNIHISNCDISAGDDAIAVTGLTFSGERTRKVDEEYKKLYQDKVRFCKNITVTNSTLQSRSSGIRIGYGSHSIKNCTFSNLIIHDSNRGIGVFVRGKGSVKNIAFDNIIISTRLHTGWWGNSEPIHLSSLRGPTNTSLGSISNIHFSNISATSESGIIVYGTKESPIRDLKFNDIDLTILNSQLNEGFGGNFDLRPTNKPSKNLFKHDIPAFYGKYIDGLSLKGFSLNWADDLPEFFSYGLQIKHFSNVDINGFEGRQAHLFDNAHAAINLIDGHSVFIHNSKASQGTSVFISYESLDGGNLFVNNNLQNAKTAISPSKSIFTLKTNLWPPKK